MKFFRLGAVAFFAVSLSAQRNNAQPSLFQAIQRGDTAVVSRLIESGISPNMTDEEGVPALMLATLFADAACVERLLERGADPNQTDAVGATLLMWAMPDILKALIGGHREHHCRVLVSSPAAEAPTARTHARSS